MGSGLDAAIDATASAVAHSRPLRQWLRAFRWCGDAIGLTTRLAVKDQALLAQSGTEGLVLFLLQIRDSEGRSRLVFLPLSIASTRFDVGAFELKAEGRTFYLEEAERRETFARVLVEGFRGGAKVRTASGDVLAFRGENLGAVRGTLPFPASDTSNVLARIVTARGESVLKSYRFPDSSNREPEILGRLQARAFRNVARFVGELALGRGKDRLVLAIGTEHIDGTDLFSFLCDGLRQDLRPEAEGIEDFARQSQAIASDLGKATAKLHEALVSGGHGPWGIERFTREDFHHGFRGATRSLGSALRRLGHLARSAEPTLAETARVARAQLLDLREPIEATLRDLEGNVGGPKSVTHADLHLAQVLRRNADGQLFFIDFEGEPERASDDRSNKQPPLRDVGSMVRSFAYVRHYAMRRHGGGIEGPIGPFDFGASTVPGRDDMRPLAAWEASMVERFVSGYLSESGLYRGNARPEVRRLIRAWSMVKALYELDYELVHRLENFPIPLSGIADITSST